MKTLTNKQIGTVCGYFYAPLEHSFMAGWNRAVRSVHEIGVPRKAERANIVHAAVRTEFELLCDMCEPYLQMISETEGKGGADYLLLSIGDVQAGIRWSRFNGQRINRNATQRQASIMEQGYFSGMECENHDGLATCTLAYTVEDDRTEGGVPLWWIGRLSLVRERPDGVELINDVGVYERPERGSRVSVRRCVDTEVLKRKIDDAIQRIG